MREFTDLSSVSAFAESFRNEIGKAVVGQGEVIDQILVAILSEGHVLLEGVPGIAKTLIARAVSLSISAGFKRIQFTPDLMPSDVVGTSVFNPVDGCFSLKKGPIFTGILLADEINRTPPKTQAALLEAMQEKQVTIDGEMHKLDSIFTVIATQNPIEYEGTYPLPEAELDRFLFKTIVGYPALETELGVLGKYNSGFRSDKIESIGIKPAADSADIVKLREIIGKIVVSETMLSYIASVVRNTRQNRNLVLGASPRASIALVIAGKAYAAINGRDYVIPDDIKYLAYPVMRHRLILRPEAEIEGLNTERIITQVLKEVEVPRE